MTGRPLRVFAADDSAVMRGIMHKLFQAHDADGSAELPRMELCGVARDGIECLEEVKRLAPDVLVLDLEMPRLNGLEVLDRLRLQQPSLPVIMCSAHTEHGARSTLEALARGAADYVMKPGGQRDVNAALASLAQQLLPKIAALAKPAGCVTSARAVTTAHGRATPTQSNGPVELVVIGLSTGGPTALEQMLPKLPANFPAPILIVQHMPKLFTGALAERLNRSCALRVQEGYEGAVVRPGVIWIAPGDAHMEIAPQKAMLSGEPVGARVRLHRQAPLNHCMPAVDYLFFSAARMYGAGALALVMTGMGSDGLDGARAVYERGGTVLTQDEATSAVWGMPGRVAEAGIAAATLPVAAIADALQQRVNAGRAARPAAAQHAAAMTARREVVHGLY
ncbi:chemotaxis response regulator protein-glutamate methylesterase [Edaphobacter acidisoli]|uniref:Protein-glutamate methylesterase/protein-glutamine glutaminase n=2 Tax=Edaphobacter acidisoli TaxID=2040573 RepID=A0A916RJC9_9BACT|nr:chemotaxis response regulator protein-glutamate methylesterase [Edaphobacter acidisoli]